MEFDLRAAVEQLDPYQIFNIANQARPAGNYLFNSILPNRNMDTYNVEIGSMTIRTTMAGLSGMDSEYNEGGAAESSEFNAKTGKITIRSVLPEKFLRQLQFAIIKLLAKNLSTNELIQDTALNFVDKIIVQAMLDREEWLKGQALFTGKVDWTFNGKRLYADYGIPAGNFLTPRTGSDAYGGGTSKFWLDIFTMQQKLNWDVRAYILHPALLTQIMANADVNQLQFINADPATGQFTFQQLVNRAGNTVLNTDPRAKVTLTAYKEEGEVWDLANPGLTRKVPFCPVGGMIAIGAPVYDNVFLVGQGSTRPPITDNPVQLGYGHIAPTTEGGGNPGRWTRLRVPADEPWQLAADGVENFLPVIEAEKRIVIANSALV